MTSKKHADIDVLASLPLFSIEVVTSLFEKFVFSFKSAFLVNDMYRDTRATFFILIIFFCFSKKGEEGGGGGVPVITECKPGDAPLQPGKW